MSNTSKASGPSDSYIKSLQKSVPDEARSIESSEIVYVDEPSPRLDGEWNLGMKLCTQFRYTEKYAKKWREKYKFLPAAEELTDSDFFASLNLKFDKQNLLSHFCNRKKQFLPKIDLIYGKSEKQIISEAEALPEDNTKPLWALLPYFEQAYYCSKDSKYLNAWLKMFNTWYHRSRPPAQKPLVYIGFIWNRDWNTLSTAGRFSSLIRMENVLSSDKGIEIDTDSRINLYKSILEHARYLSLVNETFQPSNWQTHQMCSLLEASIAFPEFKESPGWEKTAWQRFLEHMHRETLPDGGHIELSTGYNCGVIDHYRKAVKYAEEAQIEIPGWFMDKFKNMYVWIMNLLLPGFSLPNIGDCGWLAGERVFNALSYAALKFSNPNFKWFVMNEPEKVKKAAEDFFSDPDEVIKKYNSVTAERPDYTSVLMPDTGWAVMRSSWKSETSALVIDFGSNEPFHTHADFASFSLYAYGEPLICDCGHAGAYEDDRSKLWYKKTIAHNTVMVDTQSQWRAMHGECRKWVSLSNIALIIETPEMPIIWRGPLKSITIRQFLADVNWEKLDYLIIDSPPGTGDEPLSICQLIPGISGAIIVTTPQDVAILDSTKAVYFAKELKMPVIGIVENMAGFICPYCKKKTDLFKIGGGEKAANDLDVPFLGRIPIELEMVKASDSGKPFIHFNKETETAKIIEQIVQKIEEFGAIS